MTYDEAIKAADKHGYNGVGFTIPQGYFFLNIDHKELTDPFVQLMQPCQPEVSGYALPLVWRPCA